MRKQFTFQMFAAAAIFISLGPVQFTNAQQSAKNPVTSKVTAAPPALATAHDAEPVTEEDENSPAAKPGSEGIKVHGHWVLELKNPDGKVVERREFNNSLVTVGSSITGDQILGALLSGNVTPGGLAIAFIAGPVNTPGIDTSSFCGLGGIGQPAVPSGIQCFGFYASGSQAAVMLPLIFSTQGQAGLNQSLSFSPNTNIILSGNFAVSPSYNVSSLAAVQTYASFCLPVSMETAAYFDRLKGTGYGFQQATLPPSGCVNSPVPADSGVGMGGVLTSTIIPNGPLAVAPNQIITVTVTLSFS